MAYRWHKRNGIALRCLLVCCVGRMKGAKHHALHSARGVKHCAGVMVWGYRDERCARTKKNVRAYICACLCSFIRSRAPRELYIFASPYGDIFHRTPLRALRSPPAYRLCGTCAYISGDGNCGKKKQGQAPLNARARRGAGRRNKRATPRNGAAVWWRKSDIGRWSVAEWRRARVANWRHHVSMALQPLISTRRHDIVRRFKQQQHEG